MRTHPLAHCDELTVISSHAMAGQLCARVEPGLLASSLVGCCGTWCLYRACGVWPHVRSVWLCRGAVECSRVSVQSRVGAVACLECLSLPLLPEGTSLCLELSPFLRACLVHVSCMSRACLVRVAWSHRESRLALNDE